ncbi:MAG TPA: DUF1775 domain-containing protein [Sporichthyaceae bacterium]|nr:DUF1775 domain-containing protein [Sporichthyaceae bacterium]
MGRGSQVVRAQYTRSGRGPTRAVLVCAAAGALVVASAAVADAHVTVHSKDAKPGGTDATLVFKVPNEQDDAKTVKVEIDLPTDTPLTGVVPQAPDGWSATTTADSIVFSGGTISGDDSVQFPVKVAALPNVNSVVFKALQTYSNGQVVKWIDQSAEGGPEPDHPAPTLNLLDPATLSADEVADEKEDAEKAAAKGKADAPDQVHAGTGGQATEAASAGATTPVAAMLLGLGTAAAAAVRLRRHGLHRTR